MNLLTAVLCGASLIDTTHGGLYNMLITSYEKIIIDEEIVDRVRHFVNGFDMSAHDEWIDSIQKVGPGGTYITDKMTMGNFRELYTPLVGNWDAMATWKEKGSLDVVQVANGVWKERLANAPDSLLEPEVEKDLEKYVESHLK